MSGTRTTVLGLETSCDETAVAVYDSARGLLSHCLYSQTALHAPFGGVVPELASRDHVRKLLPLVAGALDRAGITGAGLTAVAYTAGPGLVGALLVGATLGVGLGMAWGIPAVPVHHMEAHLLAALLEDDRPEFPFIALLVSGGHTQLVEVRGLGRYRILGETLDDAAGEAFDKGAKLLGLPYPGGPHLARLAASGRPDRFTFPRPMLRSDGLEFSFSGLKTALALQVRALEQEGMLGDQLRADMAWAYQQAIVDVLVTKSARAVGMTGIPRLIVAGGVGANRLLRSELQARLARQGARVHYPRIEFCTDNGAMVAHAACLRLQAGLPVTGHEHPLRVETRARWPLEAV